MILNLEEVQSNSVFFPQYGQNYMLIGLPQSPQKLGDTFSETSNPVFLGTIFSKYL
jgi:hypothetical protein